KQPLRERRVLPIEVGELLSDLFRELLLAFLDLPGGLLGLLAVFFKFVEFLLLFSLRQFLGPLAGVCRGIDQAAVLVQHTALGLLELLLAWRVEPREHLGFEFFAFFL